MAPLKLAGAWYDFAAEKVMKKDQDPTEICPMLF